MCGCERGRREPFFLWRLTGALPVAAGRRTPTVPRSTVPATGSQVVKYSLIYIPRGRRTRLYSAISIRQRAIQPMPNRGRAAGDGANRRTIRRATTTVIASMIGAPTSSALLAPSRGTTHRTRIGPSMKPAPSTKYSRPAFTIRIRFPGVTREDGSSVVHHASHQQSGRQRGERRVATARSYNTQTLLCSWT